MMAADLDLSYLTNEEKEAILSVLQRDTELRTLEQERIRQLKEELRALRMKGVNRGDRSATQSCSRCCESFGWFFNRGVICVQCLQKVCDKCQQVVPAGKVLCLFCMKQLELEAKCAVWFYAKVPRKSTSDRATTEVATGADVTRASLLRVRPSHLTRRNKTTSDLSRASYEENNNTSPPLSTSSSQPGCNSVVNNRRSCQSGSSLGSPISTSMPSIAALAVNLSNNKNNAGVNGTASDEENEDIGEMFALYGGSRKANSQTNLNKLSLYSGSKESITSCYSDAGEENYGKYPVTGEILFGLNYNYTLNILEITIRRCKDLAPVDPKRNRSDPYVKTYLLPDRTKTGKRKTRVKKHTLSPVFDEIMKYQIMKSELETRTLSVMVWNNDRFGRNDFLGEVNIPLDYYPFDNPTPIWHKLQDRVPSPVSMLTYKGDLNLCLKFVSAEHISGKRRGPNYKGELQVIVKEARNLTAVRSNGFSDPFCKGYLLPEKSQKAKQKTTVVKKNCSPKWNHTFIFENISWDELQQRSLELTLWDYDRLTSNDFLGGVRLNLGTGQSNGSGVEWMDSKGDELALWQAMMDRPNCWIEGTLLLRLNMNQRK